MVPDGVYLIKSIELVGASGGAGGHSATRGGSGSGGGAYCAKNNIPVSPGDNIAYVVGLHGNGGQSGVITATDGGASTCTAYSLSAGGGIHGNNNAGTPGAGGTASGGDVNTSGSPGIQGNTTNGGAGGNAAPPLGGAGGGIAAQGTAPGGGSGGPNPSGLTFVAPAGRDGQVVFSW